MCRPAAALLSLTLVVACGTERRDQKPSASPAQFPAPPPVPEAAQDTTTQLVDAKAPTQKRPAAFAERIEERRALVRAISDEGIRAPDVLRAMQTVPRHAFVLPSYRAQAYVDRAMPIVGGQTISQPFVVAFMTQAVRPMKTSKCLEIGTGSGYQAAVLAEICAHTYSIEYLPEVARFGATNLRALGYGPDRVSLRVGDGYAGWPEAAPFDVILVTAAPRKMPQPLTEQLAVGGRLVAPIGPQGETQELERWTRIRTGADTGAFRKESLLLVQFVPFSGGHGG